MNEVIIKENDVIENLIYEIRGVQVMLDSDLAKLYECANGTKTINQAVKRHINRFPERFMFQLTPEEAKQISRSQVGTLNQRGHNIKYLPYVFTEQGVAMLATVIRTPVAEEVSIKIMDAFVAMRKYISNNLLNQKYINDIVLEDHDKLKKLEKSFKQFEEKRKDHEIYFNGQIYDAYSKIQEIFKQAKQNIIIIDSYADNATLDIIRHLKVKVTIITRPNNLLNKTDIFKYNKQYNNLKVSYDSSFHDRYFILDKKIVYHCGASINRIGYKTFSITLIGDDDVGKLLINKVNKII